jgi:hypothetical protein
MAVREELWPRPCLLEGRPFLSLLYGLMVYGLSAQAPDTLKIELARV